MCPCIHNKLLEKLPPMQQCRGFICVLMQSIWIIHILGEFFPTSGMVLRKLIMPAKISKWEEQDIMKSIISRIAVMNALQRELTMWRVPKMKHNISSICTWVSIRNDSSNLSWGCREIIALMVSVLGKVQVQWHITLVCMCCKQSLMCCLIEGDKWVHLSDHVMQIQ